MRFSLTYSGSGQWSTQYHATPPNAGGNPDTNDARDSSTQRWSLGFLSSLSVPACQPGRGRRDPCRAVRGLRGAKGTNLAAGNVTHSHLDGLYTVFNTSISCHVSATAPRGTIIPSTVTVVYDQRRGAIVLTAADPDFAALSELPGACPEQGDPIDGLLDNYFTPGFSFSARWGETRWFTSASVTIPVATLHRARKIAIPLAATRAGTPPRGCAVVHPSYEHCTTGGRWAGTLTLTLAGRR